MSPKTSPVPTQSVPVSEMYDWQYEAYLADPAYAFSPADDDLHAQAGSGLAA